MSDLQNKFNKLWLEENKKGNTQTQLPSCLGPCDECKYRAEEWAKMLNCTPDEVYELYYPENYE